MTTVTIATHDGIFHADDVFACHILKSIVETDSDVEVTINRVSNQDSDAIAAADYRVDIGTAYDRDNLTFDHHQRENKPLRPDGTPYASAGLIWLEYGKLYIQQYLSVYKGIRGEQPDGLVQSIWLDIDQRIIRGIDAVDNGLIKHAGGIASATLDERDYSISAMIADFVPTWDRQIDTMDRDFASAMKLADQVLWRAMNQSYGRFMARELLAEEVAHNTGEIIDLPTGLPWQETVCSLPNAKFVVWFDHLKNQWSGQAVPVAAGSRELRCRFVDKTTIDGVIFIHSARFFAATTTHIAMFELIQESLNAAE